MEKNALLQLEWHKNQAITNFNATWDLMDKENRTPDEELKMVHMAHASRFHWEEVGDPINLARGEWQISRVYAILGMGSSALFHAEHSLNYCLKNHIADLDLAFAYEAIARAYKVKGNIETSIAFHLEAKAAAELIVKLEDKEYFLSELESVLD